MSDLFADAFFYIALLNPADQFHAIAVQAAQGLRQRLVTTTWVLMEVADALSSPAIRLHTFRFLNQIAADPNTAILPADASWYSRGLRLYGSRADKSWSLTDCISFEVMNDRGLTEALTGDHNFEQAGFRALFIP